MRYGVKLFLTAAVTIVAVALTNYVADPYGAFNAVDAGPIQQPRFEANVRMAKAHVVSRYRPEALILGTSRAEIGFSPQHPAWPYERVYNLGLPAASMREMHDYFAHAVASGSLKQAVIALDFFQFNPMLEPRPDFDDCRLRVPGSSWRTLRASFCDLPVLLFSRQAFFASIARYLPGEFETVYLRDGSRNAEAKENSLARLGSQHAAFLDTEQRYAESVDRLRGFLVSEVGFEATTGRYYEAMLRLAYTHAVDVRVLISPSHARHWELIRALGLWPEFQRWKQYLVLTANTLAQEYAVAAFPVWDFANYNVYSLEQVPDADDPEARMRWYWESSHFTQALGDLALAQVLTGSLAGAGTLLEATEFDALAQEVEKRRTFYYSRLNGVHGQDLLQWGLRRSDPPRRQAALEGDG